MSTVMTGNEVITVKWKFLCVIRRKLKNVFRVPAITRKTGKSEETRNVCPVRARSGNFKILPECQGIIG